LWAFLFFKPTRDISGLTYSYLVNKADLDLDIVSFELFNTFYHATFHSKIINLVVGLQNLAFFRHNSFLFFFIRIYLTFYHKSSISGSRKQFVY
jgi:hypothetical protein